MIDNLINEFIEKMEESSFHLYNEAGLQHELGYFLRCNNIKTYFEYNLELILDTPKNKFLKKELDLFIENDKEKICIELKFPTNGAYPRRMTQSIIDMFFLQQLINIGFSKGYLLFITDLKGFKEGKKGDGVYSYFRKSKDLSSFEKNDIPEFMLNDKNREVKVLFELLDNNSLKLNYENKIEFRTIVNKNKNYHIFLMKIE